MITVTEENENEKQDCLSTEGEPPANVYI